jgi:hypothetical protein
VADLVLKSVGFRNGPIVNIVVLAAFILLLMANIDMFSTVWKVFYFETWRA